jgi:hypothetical protein
VETTLTTQFAYAGALITLALGLLGLFAPTRLARLVSITPVGRVGVSEIRATYGGLFTALALTALIAQERALFGVVGAGWAGIAAGRLWSFWRDASRERRNVIALLMELGVAYLLVAPVIAVWTREATR